MPGMRRMGGRRVRGRCLRRLEHAGHGADVSLPGGDLGAELRAPARRELVELCLAIVLGESPLALDPALALQAMQGRVERTLLDEKRVVAPFADEPRHGVAVHWPPGQRSEDQEVERPLQQVERGHESCPLNGLWGRYESSPKLSMGTSGESMHPERRANG